MVTFPKTLTRYFVKTHRDINFVYGESQNEIDDSDFGVDICRGEPNAYGVLTCVCFSRRPEERAFNGKEVLNIIKEYIKGDIERIPLDRDIIVVHRIGEGNSLMKQSTPEFYKYMIDMLRNHLKKSTREVIWL